MPGLTLVRLGHYFTPNGATESDGTPSGSCQTALICGFSDTDNLEANLQVWKHDGESLGNRLGIPVLDKYQAQTAEWAANGASFHLSGECPFNR